MGKKFTRRDFLKFSGVFPLSFAAPEFLKRIDLQQRQQNVIVIVLDALSAYNISLYGYQRETMPNLARLAKQAVVYHNHYANSNFTTPGTASLLTGVAPWTHRAFKGNSKVISPFDKKNFFSAFQNYYSIAFTHNGWAYTLLKQFRKELDELIPSKDLFLKSYNNFVPSLFENDNDIASVSWIRAMQAERGIFAYSLFLSRLYKWLQQRNLEKQMVQFPRGLPTAGANFDFLLEDAIDYIGEGVSAVHQPFVGYFHFLPPHSPYNTSVDFYNAFKGDNFATVDKPIDIFAKEMSQSVVDQRRAEYDEFLLYCDKHFARLYNHLEMSGLLENTWIVLTSDHGELFERGIIGHTTEVLYEPVLRVPLVIFEPGRTEGMDIHIPTSSIDVLPTMLQVTGNAIPGWIEGNILPPYTTTALDYDRSIVAVRAKNNEQDAPLTQASTMMLKDSFKLHYYFGYPEISSEGMVKLFDLKSDPEELNDISEQKKETTSELLRELKQKLAKADEPYLK